MKPSQAAVSRLQLRILADACLNISQRWSVKVPNMRQPSPCWNATVDLWPFCWKGIHVILEALLVGWTAFLEWMYSPISQVLSESRAEGRVKLCEWWTEFASRTQESQGKLCLLQMGNPAKLAVSPSHLTQGIRLPFLNLSYFHTWSWFVTSPLCTQNAVHK